MLFLGSFILSACKDDDEKIDASIVGTWRGDRSEVNVKYGIIPIFDEEDDNFDVTLEFDKNGTVSYKDENGQVTTGTYEVSDDKLTTDVEFQNDFELNSATFTIVELTSNKLRLDLEEKRDITVPDYGSIEADIMVNLSFDRQ